MYTLISIVCLAILAIIAIGCLLSIFRRVHSKRIEFIRQFKKGKCAIIYIVTIPLYFIGHIYAGQEPIQAFFSSINKTMTIVVLRYDTSSISALMADDPVYEFTIYACFIMIALNAMLFVLSFLHQKIWEWLEKKRWDISQKEKLLIVGNNEDNINIYASEKNRERMLLDDIPDKEKTKLYAKSIRFISKSGDFEDIRNKKQSADFHNEIEKYCCKFLLDCLSNPQKSCVVVVNTRDDEKNIAICQSIVAHTNKYFEDKDEQVIADNLSRIRVYVFGKPMHEAIYNSIVESSNGCIHYVNKYSQIATDFIEKYPLTQFMTEAQIDYDTSLMRDKVDINVAMIGFGKTNQQIFLTSVANNQFLTEENGKKVLKQVHYCIFDKQYAENNKNLNHSYYRFKNEFAEKIKEQKEGAEPQPYLPFPMLPAEDHFDKLDINDSAFYKKLKSELSGEGKFNYVIIAFGTDLENVDMAQKMLEKKQEWELKDTFIFVKVRSGNDSFEIFKRNDCFLIGDEAESVYNIERMDDDVITNMAKLRNRIYALEYAIKMKDGTKPDENAEVSIKSIYSKADCDWYIKKTQIERESNVYACLSLRSKLHLMGLDYIPSGEANGNALDNAAYLNIYAKHDRPVMYPNISADGKEIVKYDLDFKDSRRKTMAIHEHLRWNSFMISKGLVPASKDEILLDQKNGKNYELRRHGNLTTFDGLIEFRRLIATRDGKNELETDVIKYDYQLLDDAHWLLSQKGYEIVKREK